MLGYIILNQDTPNGYLVSTFFRFIARVNVFIMPSRNFFPVIIGRYMLSLVFGTSIALRMIKVTFSLRRSEK
jgi:hypothetical protein